MPNLISRKRGNKIVAGLARPAVAEAALEVGVRAEGLLAAHRKTGSHRIDVSQHKVDAYVTLSGPGAAALEQGHFSGYKGDRKWVEGIHVLRRAARL